MKNFISQLLVALLVTFPLLQCRRDRPTPSPGESPQSISMVITAKDAERLVLLQMPVPPNESKTFVL